MNVNEALDVLAHFGGHLPVYAGSANAEESPKPVDISVETETVDGDLVVVVRPVE